MLQKRLNYTSTFKAKVALAALKGNKTLPELAEQYEIQVNQITDWEMQLIENAEIIFVVTTNEKKHLDKRLSGARILLVEDNEFSKEIAIELLTSSSMQVTVANNGQEALNILATTQFDGVLMDMQMPVMDGLTATREIRKQEKYADLPIIALTANTMVGDRQKALMAGMNDHIAKPIVPQNMIDVLGSWISQSPTNSSLPSVTTETDQSEQNDTLDVLNYINTRQGLTYCNNNLALYYRTLVRFKDKEQSFMARFDQVCQINDIKSANILIHNLKTLSGTIGASKLHLATQLLEDLCQSGCIPESNSEQRVTVNIELDAVLKVLEQLDKMTMFAEIIANADKKLSNSINSKITCPSILIQQINQLQSLLADYDAAAEKLLEQINLNQYDFLPKKEVEMLYLNVSNFDLRAAHKSITKIQKTLTIC